MKLSDEERGGVMANLANRLQDQADRFALWILGHIDILRDPESMVGLFIVTLWAVLAGSWGGWVAIVIFVVLSASLHFMAIESGNHVVLWLSTAALLVLIVIASEATFDGLSPVVLSLSGASALVHNELIRVNYARRRNATMHEQVFHASGVATGAAVGVAAIGVVVAQVAAAGDSRNWLWMPAAFGALLIIGLVLSIGPARRASDASRERWQPGDRIPPQPLAGEDPELF